jgi:chorismate mutase
MNYMTSEEIKELNAARESLVKRRREMARQIAEAPLPSVEMAEELTKILAAIEALDRALNEAGHPYMSQSVAAQMQADA